jgi:hypothetical protein
MEKSIASKKVTYDFARLMDGATQVSLLGLWDPQDDPLAQQNRRCGFGCA